MINNPRIIMNDVSLIIGCDAIIVVCDVDTGIIHITSLIW
jgi:hypothetical protein